jgi:prepilin-type N-terminal cleavage/methylation domain-containing protein
VRRQQTQNHGGFTLVELIVAMAIIAVLSGLAYFVAPGLIKTQSASRGAEKVQSTLFIAKQQALRDRVPYGVRFLRDPATNNFNAMVYLNQPLDFIDGQVQIGAATVNGSSQQVVVRFQGVALDGGLADASLWPVRPGDTFLTPRDSPGTPFQIVAVSSQAGVTVPAGSLPPNSILIAVPPGVLPPPSTGGAFLGSYYRIMRSPRPALGEEIQQLPEDVIIEAPVAFGGGSFIDPDPATATTDTPAGFYDVLFSPTGRVIGPGGRRGKVVLWVRDVNANRNTAIEQSLIVVFTRTGRVASYQVDTSGSGNFYSIILTDPRGGGL